MAEVGDIGPSGLQIQAKMAPSSQAAESAVSSEKSDASDAMPNLQVFVAGRNGIHSLCINPLAKIKRVEEMTEAALNISPGERIRLSIPTNTMLCVHKRIRDPLQIYIRTASGKTIRLDVESSDTFEDMKIQLQDMEGIPVSQQRLIYSDKEVENLSELRDSNILPQSTLFMEPVSSEIRLLVNTTAGQVFTLDVDELATISKVKAKIQERKGISPQHIRLMHNQESIHHGRRLADLGIEKGCMLNMEVPLKGGSVKLVPFNALQNSQPTKFASSGPNYRTVKKGINFTSECTNPSCVAFQDTIVVPIGFGHFNVARVTGTLKCPKCNSTAKSSMNCNFYMAAWEFYGKLQNGEEKRIKGRADTNHYYTYEEGDDVQWEFLEVDVFEIAKDESICLLF